MMKDSKGGILMKMIEHPDIGRIERTGYGRSNDLKFPTCPRCGEELTINDDVYTDFLGKIIGCSNCLTCHEASEVCFDE